MESVSQAVPVATKKVIAGRLFAGATLLLAVISMIAEATGKWFEQLSHVDWSPLWYVAYGLLTALLIGLQIALDRRDQAAATRLVPWAGAAMAVAATFAVGFAPLSPLAAMAPFFGVFVGVCGLSPYFSLTLLISLLAKARRGIAEEDRRETWQAFWVLFALTVLVMLSLWHVSPLMKFGHPI